jgi:hypothetical protein
MAAFDEEDDADEGQVPKRLVQEGRVIGGDVFESGRSVGRVDVDRPGQAGGAPVELLVEPVAPPSDGLGQGQDGGDGVEEGWDGQVASAGDDVAGDDTRRDAAGDAEPAVPDGQGAPRVVRVQLVVGDDVVEAGAEDAGGHGPQGDGADVAGTSAPGRPAAFAQYTAAMTPRAIISP